MLTMRDHGVEDYEALRHMDTTDVGELSDDDRACLEELGQYLVSTDAWRRFGIWLLHKHSSRSRARFSSSAPSGRHDGRKLRLSCARLLPCRV